MRPAFYALRPGGWRDYVTLVHLPYTAWNVSYVLIGGCLAPTVPWGRLALAAAAFALALGIGAHALDELDGRPLGTQIPSRVLVALAVASIGTASAIGMAVAVGTTLWLLAFVAAGAFLVPAYNLRLFGGWFHSALWLGLAWAAFPILTAYYACARTIRPEAVLAAAAGTALILAQRTLSTPVRHLRRDVREVRGTLELGDGGSEPLDRRTLVAPSERALLLMAATSILAAAALVAARL